MVRLSRLSATSFINCNTGLKEPQSMEASQPVAQAATGVEIEPPKDPQFKLLSQEERNDLRKKVLRGEDLTLFEARSVYETLRSGQGAAVVTGESSKKSRKKREAYSDASLDADLAN